MERMDAFVGPIILIPEKKVKNANTLENNTRLIIENQPNASILKTSVLVYNPPVKNDNEANKVRKALVTTGVTLSPILSPSTIKQAYAIEEQIANHTPMVLILPDGEPNTRINPKKEIIIATSSFRDTFSLFTKNERITTKTGDKYSNNTANEAGIYFIDK
jgi:hypothetical protein